MYNVCGDACQLLVFKCQAQWVKIMRQLNSILRERIEKGKNWLGTDSDAFASLFLQCPLCHLREITDRIIISQCFFKLIF